MKAIDDKFCFNPKVDDLTAGVSNKALRKYVDGFEVAKTLGIDLPIVLDTNILLGYYGMSQVEKKKLMEFIEKYKDRIYITKQVEKEYLRNRLSVINKDFFTPLKNIAENYESLCADINGKLQSFRESNKKILSQDYSDLWGQFQQIEEEIKEIISNDTFRDDLRTKIGATAQNNKNIALVDDLLAVVSDLKITPALTTEEMTFLKAHFDSLVKEYEDARETVKWMFALPGCGDKKEKEDASGDFIIFHEMLRLLETEGKSCIFLTNDVTKGDWLREDKNPHNHYIEQAFRSTQQVIYILHAERTLTDISFENIHKLEEQSEKIDIFESTIVTINYNRKFAFLLHPNKNLYFNSSEYDGDFDDLQVNDIVNFEKGRNIAGDVVAKNIRKVYYSFDNPINEIRRGKIANINHPKGFGFILNQPENLYFHQNFLADLTVPFDSIEIGDDVEFIMGKNAEGDNIARVVRIIV